ncbi:putative ABC transport system permease protein [Massilia sp. PDC64]|nr:iron export ABC transporter permease subunit FetB [Massilia sp. PDC64]SDD71201.1 putative ABC transport system permease protein [Massilia sp. PDC64]
MNAIHLGTWDLLAAAILIVLDAALSLALGLGLHRQILVAAVRMVAQLTIVGLVLRHVFATSSPAATLAVVLFMIAAAAREVATRPRQRLKRHMNYRISAAVVSCTGVATVLLALTTAVRPTPWYEPRYAIPLMGIVLGSVLNAASLALDGILDGVVRERARIEARIALGTPFREAIGPLVRNATRRGMIPVANQMSAAGIITLPGIMTGQLLAGMDPIEAVKYQILLMFLLAGASGLAAVGAAMLAVRALSDDRQRLRVDRLRD